MKLILFLMTIFAINLQAQTLKTYNGPFELNKIKYDEYSVEYQDEKFLEGTAVCTYYEDSIDNWTLHGSFKYTSKNVDGQIMILQGSYKNGLKDGSWTMSITCNSNFTNNAGKTTVVGSEKLIGSFENGLRTGLWTYSKNMNTKVSFYNAYTKSYGNPKTKNEVISSTVSFVKGKFAGVYSYKSNVNTNGSVKNVGVTGQFDKDYYMTGRWVYTEGVDQVIEEFVQGVNKSFVLKTVGTGVARDRDDNVEEQKLYQQYVKNPDDSTIQFCKYCRVLSRYEGSIVFSRMIYLTTGSIKGNPYYIASNTIRIAKN